MFFISTALCSRIQFDVRFAESRKRIKGSIPNTTHAKAKRLTVIKGVGRIDTIVIKVHVVCPRQGVLC